MKTIRLSVAFAVILVAGLWSALAVAQARDDDDATKALDRKFDTMLTAARKEPKKADWKALRRAFSRTSHYQPYDTSWRKDIVDVIKNMQSGNLNAAEAGLVKLIEREGSMRLDVHAVAVDLYEKMGNSEKARKHKDFVEGLSSTLFAAGEGTTIERPVEVLFVDEEYSVLRAMRLKIRSQSLSERDGHRFDILTTQAGPDQPGPTLYFNIDMPWISLETGMAKAFETSKKTEPKKK